MSHFATALATHRKQSGFKSARAFFTSLSEKAHLGFDYSYYSRMEQGRVLPSEKIVQKIVSLLNPIEVREELVKAYCRDLFPTFHNLFPVVQNEEPLAPKAEKKSPTFESAVRNQVFLTLSQVEVVSRDKITYFLFLISTHARRHLTTQEFEDFLVERLKCTKAEISAALGQLAAAKIIAREKEGYYCYMRENHFPPRAMDSRLEPIYKRLDEWDIEFAEVLQFTARHRKFLLRRVPAKNIPMIVNLAKTLVTLIETSEDSNESLNTELVSFMQRVHVGKLIG